MARIITIASILLTMFSQGCCCCSQWQGLFTVQVPAQHEAYDYEFVPRRSLVKVDAGPEWELGRFETEPGEDDLLIITRTYSKSDYDDEGHVIEGTMRQRKRDRLWIVIPAGLSVGDTFELDSEAENHAVGTDVELEGRYRVVPFRAIGLVKLVARDDDAMSFLVGVRVRQFPPIGDEWSFTDMIRAPIVPVGRDTE